MSDYPTSGTRTGSSERSGFPGAGELSTAAAAGFLSPAAGKAYSNARAKALTAAYNAAQARVSNRAAMARIARAAERTAARVAAKAVAEAMVAGRALIPPVAVSAPPVGAPPQIITGTVARSALRGLLPIAVRLVPWAVAAYAAYELYNWYVGERVHVSDYSASGYGRTGYCAGGPSPNYAGGYVHVYDNAPMPAGVPVASYADVCLINQALVPNQGTTATRGIIIAKQRTTPPTPVRYQIMETWSRPLAGSRPYVAYWFPQEQTLEEMEFGFAEGVPYAEPQNDDAGLLDPLIEPGRVPWLAPVLPFEALPYRTGNPWRSPTEQSSSGFEAPLRVGETWRINEDDVLLDWLVLAPSVDPTKPAPVWVWPDYVPAELPLDLPRSRPAVETPPGYAIRQMPGEAVETEVIPEVDPQASMDFAGQGPPIFHEAPPGAAGPTIIIGGGPSVGTHQRVPPGPKEKERKARWVGAGSSRLGAMLIRKGVNPVTEALEKLDCLYKSLPKTERWQTQLKSWERQKSEAFADGRKLTKKNRSAIEKVQGPKIDVSALAEYVGAGDFVGKGQSISLPGSPRRYVDVDLSKNHLSGLSPQEKAKAVYQHYDKLDLSAAVTCMVLDGIEDRIYGGLGRLSAKGARKIGRPIGFQTGPVF